MTSSANSSFTRLPPLPPSCPTGRLSNRRANLAGKSSGLFTKGKARTGHIYVLFAVVVMTLAFTTTASAYDRPPFPVYGLKPDGVAQSTTAAESGLRSRFPGIVKVNCQGIAMRGYTAADWSFVHGLTRYWDKLLCFGVTRNRHLFGVIYDAKGLSSSAWIIYRLTGATLTDLYA